MLCGGKKKKKKKKKMLQNLPNLHPPFHLFYNLIIIDAHNEERISIES